MAGSGKYPFTHYQRGDIRDCFGSILHEKLMKVVKTRVGDKLILSLIEEWLKKSSGPACSEKSPQKGLLQGGIISPLLVLYLLKENILNSRPQIVFSSVWITAIDMSIL